MTEIPRSTSMPDHEAIAAEHMVPNVSIGAATIGLGRSAVANRLKDMPDAETQERVLQDARYGLAAVEDEERPHINNLLNESLPEGLKTLLNAEHAGEPEFDMIGLLTATEGFGRNKKNTVTDETFANFLDWHNHKLAAKQAELDKNSEQYKEAFIADIHKAIDDGWMPVSVLQQLPRLDNVKLVLDDGFTTMVRGKGGYTGKTNNNQGRAIVFSPDMLQENPKELTYHELLHVLVGADIDPEHIDDSAGTQQTNKGMMRLFGRYGGHALEEATIEHMTQSLAHGDVDKVKPEDRDQSRSDAIYYDNRTLLDTLCNDGSEKIDIRLFIAEYFRQPDLSIDWERATMMHQLFGDPLPEAVNLEPNPELIEKLHRSFAFTDVITEVKQLRSDSKLAIKAYTENLQERAAA